ncbi:SitA6 family polymorphic toxin lipoprotein [Stigmatella hybrida]|uniref:SitA6 family polymorphic toxin lipoprotein n=1 Tax=Stigmatella hybrida TaxID=394097 RepID=UPI001CDA6BAC|nr:TIGR02269 family lipoprotein [Stigmatella hybrida]
MKTPFRLLALLLVSLATPQFSGCATTSPATRAWEEVASESASECEDPASDQCIVLACEGEAGVCGVFSCEDVEPEAVARSSLEHGAELARYRPPMRSPGSSRNWRNTGLREGTRPRMSFHFRYREGFLPAFPKLEGRLVKHHFFPQAADLARWFKAQGIKVHDWTMVIPEHVHWRIHSGSARGGLWNQAWREFRDTNPTRRYTQEELLAKAFELAFRFDVVGPIIPYGRSLVPPAGPQLFAQ